MTACETHRSGSEGPEAPAFCFAMQSRHGRRREMAQKRRVAVQPRRRSRLRPGSHPKRGREGPPDRFVNRCVAARAGVGSGAIG